MKRPDETKYLSCNCGKWNVPDFPIQPIATVPLFIAEEAYKEYAAQYGTRQSLERLGERGGFGAAELAVLLYERIKRLEHIIQIGVSSRTSDGR